MRISRREFLIMALVFVSGLTKLVNAEPIKSKPVNLADYMVVFSSNRDNPSNDKNWSLYSINADGSDKKRITRGNFYDRRNSISPDGKIIVFESNRDGKWNLYSINANGDEKSLKRLTIRGNNIHPLFSNNGNVFFYSRRDEDSPWRMNFMEVDGKNKRKLIDEDWDKICDESKLDTNYLIRLQVEGLVDGLDFYKPGELIESIDPSRIRKWVNYDLGDIIKLIDKNGLEEVLKSPFLLRRLSNKKVIYRSDEDGTEDIFSIYSDGNGKEKLVTKILGQANNYDIFVKPVEGVERRLTTNQYFDRFPSVSGPIIQE
jgi:hypothetical protein